KSRREAPRARRASRPACEPLEDRCVPTTTVLTTLANVNGSVVDPNNPLGLTRDYTNVIRINGTTLGGMDFGNDITRTGTPKVNDRSNMVVVDQITTYNLKNGSNPPANFNPDTLTVVTAAQGHVSAIDISDPAHPVFTVNFDSGQVALFLVSPAGGYNPQ